GSSSSSSPAFQAAPAQPIMTQAAKCLSQVKKGLNLTGGYCRPKRMINGVATAQGAQDRTRVRNKRLQAWCIPSARIAKTVCVALNRPMASQTKAIQNHRGSKVDACMLRIVSQRPR